MVHKIYMYVNQISLIVFNHISPVGFNKISPIGSNYKWFAKSTRVSTRLNYVIQTDSKQLFVCLLGCVQDSLAKIVTNISKYWYITSVRKSLHWLPIEHRFVFNYVLLVYKFLQTDYIILNFFLNLDTVCTIYS